jgi:hypothetical protein
VVEQHALTGFDGHGQTTQLAFDAFPVVERRLQRRRDVGRRQTPAAVR